VWVRMGQLLGPVPDRGPPVNDLCFKLFPDILIVPLCAVCPCVSRTARRAGATESQAASAPAHAPETEITNMASPGSNTGRRGVIKVTGTGAAAVLPGSPRIKRGAESDEGGKARELSCS
ncbi:hypothetical protein GOODEAATRI_032251, partial [Goodea atripinnis]